MANPCKHRIRKRIKRVDPSAVMTRIGEQVKDALLSDAFKDIFLLSYLFIYV